MFDWKWVPRYLHSVTLFTTKFSIVYSHVFHVNVISFCYPEDPWGCNISFKEILTHFPCCFLQERYDLRSGQASEEKSNMLCLSINTPLSSWSKAFAHFDIVASTGAPIFVKSLRASVKMCKLRGIISYKSCVTLYRI